jgi:hypothetical protein
VIHLPDQRNRRAEHDRADARAEIREHRPSPAGEPGAGPIGRHNPRKQDREAERARDLGPIGGNEGKKCGGDQQAAENAHHDRDIDARSQWRERVADRAANLGADDAVRLPAGEIAIKSLSISAFEHRRPSFGRCCFGRCYTGFLTTRIRFGCGAHLPLSVRARLRYAKMRARDQGLRRPATSSREP